MCLTKRAPTGPGITTIRDGGELLRVQGCCTAAGGCFSGSARYFFTEREGYVCWGPAHHLEHGIIVIGEALAFRP